MTVPSLLKFPGIPYRLVALMHPDSFFTEFKQFAITSMVAIFNIDIFHNAHSSCASRVYEDNVLTIDLGTWLQRNRKEFGDD